VSAEIRSVWDLLLSRAKKVNVIFQGERRDQRVQTDSS
jgi:hypothetical protein